MYHGEKKNNYKKNILFKVEEMVTAYGGCNHLWCVYFMGIGMCWNENVLGMRNRNEISLFT